MIFMQARSLSGEARQIVPVDDHVVLEHDILIGAIVAEQLLPELFGGLSIALARSFRVVDATVSNPSTEHWDRVFTLLNETFRRRLAGLDGVDLTTRLRLVLRDFVRFQAAHPELHRFMIQEGMRKSPRLEWLVETHIRPIYDFVRAMIEAAQREGMTVIGRPEHLHYMLIGAASSVYALAAEFELLTGASADEDALVEEHVAALERMFFPER